MLHNLEENKNELIFLHKVIPGGASRSYGIEAARLAGVPKKVVEKAKAILQNIEENANTRSKISSTTFKRHKDG